MSTKRESDDGGETGETPTVSTGRDEMTTLSLHSFSESHDDENSFFALQIIENMREEYGTSLPGLVAAKVGADVTLTDDSKRPEVLENIKRVCDLNNLDCKVAGLTWGIWDAQIFDLHPQILLGADVLYDTSAFDDLFSTVAFLLQSTLGSVFITTYHNRSGHHLIEFLMVKWGLKCVKLLDAFSFMPSDKASGLGGNIQLAEIVLVNQQVTSCS